MKKEIIVDLFCGSGGASIGMKNVFPKSRIIGVDNIHQKEYWFEFRELDVFDPEVKELINQKEVFFVWASPPCQAFSCATAQYRDRIEYPDLVAATRDLLEASGKFWVMENVLQAPMRQDLFLCGRMFDLQVFRHRIFESNFSLTQIPHQKHKEKTFAKGGTIYSVFGDGGGKTHGTRLQWAIAMGLQGMISSERGLTNAVPPAYSEYILKEFKNYLVKNPGIKPAMKAKEQVPRKRKKNLTMNNTEGLTLDAFF